jgi:Domain of unknown function (DUF6306)
MSFRQAETPTVAAAKAGFSAATDARAGDSYMGYAGKDELIGFLNELLEAERAGARFTFESARAAGSDRIAELLRAIQRDEARRCGMLLGHIEALGEIPSRQIGAFYGKAMAISDVAEGIRLLNRSQGWVVRKLRQMLAARAQR